MVVDLVVVVAVAAVDVVVVVAVAAVDVVVVVWAWWWSPGNDIVVVVVAASNAKAFGQQDISYGAVKNKVCDYCVIDHKQKAFGVAWIRGWASGSQLDTRLDMTDIPRS